MVEVKGVELVGGIAGGKEGVRRIRNKWLRASKESLTAVGEGSVGYAPA